jgi:hypothetical protein
VLSGRGLDDAAENVLACRIDRAVQQQHERNQQQVRRAKDHGERVGMFRRGLLLLGFPGRRNGRVRMVGRAVDVVGQLKLRREQNGADQQQLIDPEGFDETGGHDLSEDSSQGRAKTDDREQALPLVPAVQVVGERPELRDDRSSPPARLLAFITRRSPPHASSHVPAGSR